MRICIDRRALEAKMNVGSWEQDDDKLTIVASAFVNAEGPQLLSKAPREHLREELTQMEFDNMMYDLMETVDRHVVVSCLITR